LGIGCRGKYLGTKKDKVTEECKKLHTEKLRVLYSSPDIVCMIKSRRVTPAAHVAYIWEERNALRGLVGKPEGGRPLGRPMNM
jgi:hypothetical protein